MCKRNSEINIIRQWTIVLTLTVAGVASGNKYTDKLPISEEQMKELADVVCEDLYFDPEDFEYKICQKRFYSSPSKKLFPGAEVQVTSQTETSVTVSLAPSENYQLVVLVPTNDSDDVISNGFLGPNETSFEIYTQGQEDLQIWSTTIDPSGRRGLWRKGSKVPHWKRPEFKSCIIKRKDNFTVDNANLSDTTVKVEFTWSDCENDQVFVINQCQKGVLGDLFTAKLGQRDNRSVIIKNLMLDDHCTITVKGKYGNGSLEYETPAWIDDIWVPEIPKNISIWSTSESNGQEWDVTVSWAEPAHQPLQYNISVLANTTHYIVVPGNVTEAVINGVEGDYIFSVTLVAVTPMGNAHATRRALFPRLKKSSLFLTITAAWCVVLLVSIGAVGGFLWIRKLGRDRSIQGYPPDIRGIAEMSGHECLIAEDSWEVRQDRLLLHEVIGEGEFGVVRKGTLSPGGKEVAVKMLKDYPAVEEIRSFRAEMELMKNVGAHPHVVSLVGCCSRQRPMIVAEYCSRGNLLNYLRCAWGIMVSKRNAKYYNNNIEIGGNYRNDLFKKSDKDDSKIVVNKLYDLQGVCDAELTPVDLLSFCRQIAMGMEFLASNRVVHRDLAARNILVTGDRTLKIADFGLSRDVYQENQYEQKGTGKLPIKWMALESLMRRIYTSQSDVWSFGVVIWEVVTVGGSPYPGIAANQLPRLLRSGYRMPKPNNCSKQLYELMQGCWRARARDRPTFGYLHQTLDTLLNSACADDYLTLDIEGDDVPLTPRPSRYLRLLARTKRYLSNKTDLNLYNKAEIYERPLNTQSNHYTSPPDTLSRTQVI